jgi:small redox-active disulfide protein 2
MRNIQILGTGCAKCVKLAEAAENAAKTAGIEYQLEKVTDMQRIISFGVMATPALVVDGEVKVSGRVPSVEELKGMLQ